VLKVALRQTPLKVDGKLDDWAQTTWVKLDDKTRAAVTVSQGRLYAAFKTDNPHLLTNTGKSWQVLFKTGGALDLMIGANPKADPKRDKPVAGDLRLLVTQVDGKLKAVLYRSVVPGTKQPISFSSPSRSVYLDQVNEVSRQVKLARSGGNYELSVPLETLALKPQLGQMIRGDLGILRGSGGVTIERLYWHNKASGITSDLPSEVQLTPQHWGRWQFSSEANQ
jgi:hypothetical protein